MPTFLPCSTDSKKPKNVVWKSKIMKGRYTHLAVRKRWQSFSTNDSVCLSLVMYEKSCLQNTHEASMEDTKPDLPRLYSTDEFSLERRSRPLLEGKQTNKKNSMQLTSWSYWSPRWSCLSLGQTSGWLCLGAGCRWHCPVSNSREKDGKPSQCFRLH